MRILKDCIEHNAQHLGNGIVKVDSFMNHQVDPMLMQSVGEEFARRFKHTNPTKVLTAEASGIAPALALGMAMKIPIIFARKHQPITMAKEPYREVSTSPTHGRDVEFLISSEYLIAEDRVLIIDDFLSSAKTIIALVRLVKQSKSTLVGIGAVIEKAYAKGREALEFLNIPIETLASIDRFEDKKIILK